MGAAVAESWNAGGLILLWLMEVGWMGGSAQVEV